MDYKQSWGVVKRRRGDCFTTFAITGPPVRGGDCFTTFAMTSGDCFAASRLAMTGWETAAWRLAQWRRSGGGGDLAVGKLQHLVGIFVHERVVRGDEERHAGGAHDLPEQGQNLARGHAVEFARRL